MAVQTPPPQMLRIAPVIASEPEDGAPEDIKPSA